MWAALGLIATMTTLVMAISVSPATAGASAQSGASAFCAPGAELFDALPNLGFPAARGAIVREPSLGQASSDLPASAKGVAAEGLSATVPVYFHVVTDGSIGAISNRVIRNQVEVLDLAFAGFYGGADTGFSFELAGVTRTDNAEWFYAGPTTKGERGMKAALHQGGANALNLYSTTAGAYLGWAYLPDIVTKPGQAYIDGIVVDWESMPGASDTYAGRFDLGQTATHEAGHWLDLEHTFYGGCNAKGDFVADTPAQLTPTSGCPEGKDTCSDPGLDPIHNYMDYSDDACYTEFTPGQVQRMSDAWLLYRADG
jgi:hypothetical protein